MNRTAIVYIAERCNQHCVFCLEVDESWEPLPEIASTEVVDLLGALRERGAEHITFMGGETFFRKDLGQILTAAKRQGFNRVGVTTNGTVLAKPGFVRHLVDCGLDFIEFSLHGHSEELANLIGGTNFTFQRQARALAEINEIGLFTIVNVVICRQNKDHLVDIARYLTTNFPRIPARFKFKFVQLIGLALSQANQEMLRYSEVDAVAVGDFLEARGVPFWYYNFPLCRLGRHAAHSHELGAMASDERYFDYDHKGGADYIDTGHQLSGRCWPEPCDPCTLRPMCSGVENAYWMHQGAGELSPHSDDPLPILAHALGDVFQDPALAPERLEALRKEPRRRQVEQSTSPSLAPAASAGGASAQNAVRLRLEGAQNEIVVELQLELSQPDRPAYVKVGPFSLSYLAEDKTVYEKPGVRQLLAAAAETLKQCDPAGSVQAAGAAIAKAVGSLGWTPSAEITQGAPSVLAAARGHTVPLCVGGGSADRTW
jgi:pyruvate-formate lyase-activating enzyme